MVSRERVLFDSSTVSQHTLDAVSLDERTIKHLYRLYHISLCCSRQWSSKMHSLHFRCRSAWIPAFCFSSLSTLRDALRFWRFWPSLRVSFVYRWVCWVYIKTTRWCLAIPPVDAASDPTLSRSHVRLYAAVRGSGWKPKESELWLSLSPVWLHFFQPWHRVAPTHINPL